jgi:hypothetical protein
MGKQIGFIRTLAQYSTPLLTLRWKFTNGHCYLDDDPGDNIAAIRPEARCFEKRDDDICLDHKHDTMSKPAFNGFVMPVIYLVITFAHRSDNLLRSILIDLIAIP